jgi:predicted lysophospholipase L1 biosynthesis ABC-type transport system permease subunit
MVIIINEAMAQRFFPDSDPLGQRLRFWGQWREIIGIVGNERFNGLAAEAAPAVYPPIAQAPATMGTLLVRTAGDPKAMLPAVQNAIWSIDRDLAPFEVRTMEEVLNASIANQRFLALLLATFAGVALVLALVGVYGVIAYSVAQRGREIGIRLALGASGRRVLRSVVGEGVRLAIIGSAIGVALALGAGRAVRSQLYGISAADPATIAAAASLLVAVAALGSAIPAWRAAAIPPGEVMRGS